MLNLKQLVFIFLGIGWLAALNAQTAARLNTDELTYNFGTIAENGGPASHTFTVKNIGGTPLVINRVTASCGCTQPEWTKAPIAPGQSGEVKITYNPKGRPGPFYKTISIFSNGHKGSYTLAIKGNVTPKPSAPLFTYPYSIGDLKLHTKTILYSSIRPDETLGEKISIRNEGKNSIRIEVGKLPHFLTAQVRPDTLMPGETGEIFLLMDAKAARRKGRVSAEIPLAIRSVSKKETHGKIRLAANIIDNFSKLSPAEKAEAPVAKLSGTLLEFGKLPEKGSIIPLIGGKVTGTFEITNEGKSPLAIYSVTSDDDRIDISGGKKELKPGATALFKVSIRPKEIKTKLETLINVVCNDPSGPVRLIKVTAYK